MNLRDRVVVGFLALVLVALTGTVVAPSLAPSAPDESPAPILPTLPPLRPYVEGVVGAAGTVSPFSARTAAERAIVALVFRGLVRLGPGDTLVGDLAERWTVDPTGSIWTFRLRDGLVWQDGQPLTADDVLFTVAALSDPDYTGPGAASWGEVSATAPDERTVVLTLATPLGGFLHAATQPIAPRHLLEGVAPGDLPSAAFGRRPVGSGSFRLAVLDDQHALLLPATPDLLDPDAGVPGDATPRPTDSLASPVATLPSGRPIPYLEAIEFRFFLDPAALAEAWRAGDLDGASGLAPADAAALAETAGARLLRYPTTTLLSVTLNLRAAHPEFRDPAVRRALLAALDRDGIVASVLAGQAARADSPIPPSSWAFDATASPPGAFDPAAARAALVAAGWKEAEGGGWIPKGASKPLTIELLCPEEAANPATYAVATAIADGWRGIGLTVIQTPLPGAELVGDRLRTGEFTAAIIGLGIGLDPDLYPILASTQATTSGSNLSGFQDQTLDRLLVAARAPGTDEVRKAAYIALQTQLSTGVYLLPIAFRDDVVVVRDTLTGPEIRPIGSPGDRFWDVLTWRLADGR
jgi:peptide/nickel transport system substrate-binding protein